METLDKFPRGWRKENIPPALDSYLVSEQRNIQKNINVNLYLSPGSHVTVSRHQAGSAILGFHHTGGTTHGRPHAASIRNRSAEPQPQNRVQTNLACPYWPLRDATADPSSWRQSNLESKRHRLEPLSSACPLPAVRSSCPVGSRKSPPNDPSSRSGDIPQTYKTTSKDRTGNRDQQVLTQPTGSVSMPRSSGNWEANGKPLSPMELLGVPLPGCLYPNCHPSFTSPSRSLDSLLPGPALTLDHLSSSPSAERGPSSALLQTLLESSQASADLYSSIQRLNQDIAVMGALGSFLWESKSSSLACQPPSSPQGSTSAVLSIMEQLAPKQASVKWQTPVTKDWDPGFMVGTVGDREPLPIAYKYKKTGVHGPPMEASDQGWPPGVSGGVGPTTLAFQGEESYCSTSFHYLRSCSGAQQALEEESLCGCLKTNGHQKVLPPKEPTSGVLGHSELDLGDLPLGLLSTDGLQVSLKTSCTKAPVSMGVSVYSAPQEVHLTVHSPGSPEVTPAHLFGNGSKDLDTCEPEEACRASFITNIVDELIPLPPYPNFSPFAAAAREGLRECLQGPKTLARKCSEDSLNPACHDHRPGVGRGPRELPCCWEKDRRIDIMRGKNLETDDGLMEKKRDRPLPRRSDPLLVKCFVAWRNHVSGKLAAAQAQYERRLLRKGLSALQWAVQLRNVQVVVAQRSHALKVLAVGFHRWQDAAAKQQKARVLQQREMATSTRDLPPTLERIMKLPAWCRLSAEQQEDAARYSRAEGLLWMQLHHTQGAEEPNRKMEAVRDMRRLAAAFRLWRLQTERLDQEEARARDACAILEKKKMAAVFETWRARCQANRRIVPLAARIQRGLISQCFAAWRSFAERQVLSRHGLECRRARTLRLCVQQWALMVRTREKARRTLLELLVLRQRESDGPRAPVAQPCWDIARWSPRNGTESLEALFGALTLQGAFQAWKSRWQESLLANAFQRVLTQRRLKEALAWWRWKALCLHPPGLDPRDLAEGHLLVSLDSSLSSGFLSNTATPPVSRGSLGKEGSLESSSPVGPSSLEAAEDAQLLCHLDSPSPTCSLGPDPPADVAVPFQTPSPLCNCHVGKDRFQDAGTQLVVASSTMEGTSSRTDKAENRRQLLARCFALWSAWTHQALQAQQQHRHSLLAWAFLSWAEITARNSVWHKALVEFEQAVRQRLLASCFRRWKTEFLKADQERQEEKLRRRPAGGKAVWRWRKATRGYQALRLNSAHQACNYWTKAATFRQCVRQQNSLVGARKRMKMPLSWPSRQRQNREEKRDLFSSSFHIWLMTYRGRSRALRPPGSLDVAGLIAECNQAQKSDTQSAPAMGDRQWLGKYLSLWKGNVLVRRFQMARDMQCLERAWRSWKAACREQTVAQALAKNRLVEWSWKTWRRRCLQSWVAERFWEAEEKHLLKKAFVRWRQVATVSYANGGTKLLAGWNTL